MSKLAKRLAPIVSVLALLAVREAAAKDTITTTTTPKTPASQPEPTEPAAPAETAPVTPSFVPPIQPEPAPPAEGPKLRLHARAEIGVAGVLYHRARFGEDGTCFNLMGASGRDSLSPVLRASVDLEIQRRHTLTLLYHPMQIGSTVRPEHDLTVDHTTFGRGEPMIVHRGTTLYRLSYLFNTLPAADSELAFGVSAQVHDTTLQVSSRDGSSFVYGHDTGILPLLKSRGRLALPDELFVGYEIDGIYAPIRVLNGRGDDRARAFLDASLRVGQKLGSRGELFLNVRYLGSGTGGPSEPGQTYGGLNGDWLHMVSFSIGGTISSP